MSKLVDSACLWRKKLNFIFSMSLFSGIAPNSALTLHCANMNMNRKCGRDAPPSMKFSLSSSLCYPGFVAFVCWKYLWKNFVLKKRPMPKNPMYRWLLLRRFRGMFGDKWRRLMTRQLLTDSAILSLQLYPPELLVMTPNDKLSYHSFPFTVKTIRHKFTCIWLSLIFKHKDATFDEESKGFVKKPVPFSRNIPMLLIKGCILLVVPLLRCFASSVVNVELNR